MQMNSLQFLFHSYEVWIFNKIEYFHCVVVGIVTFQYQITKESNGKRFQLQCVTSFRLKIEWSRKEQSERIRRLTLLSSWAMTCSRKLTICSQIIWTFRVTVLKHKAICHQRKCSKESFTPLNTVSIQRTHNKIARLF